MRHWPAAAVIALFATFAVWSLPHGLGSVDGHGIVATVNQLVERHSVGVSRPPGHPTHEFYLLGGVAWLLRSIGHPFGPTAFLVFQGVVAVAVAIIFYEWLLRLGILPLRAACGVFCLLASPQFLKQAADGEEFLTALLFLLLAVRVLSPYASDFRPWRIYGSIALFVAATGCRPELALFGLLNYIVFARYHRLGTTRVLAGLAVAALAFAIVWAPVLGSVGIVPPYDDGVDARHRLALWGYKLLFQAFGLPVALIFFGILAAALLRCRVRTESAVRDFDGAIAPWIAALYCVAFCAYPTKPAFLLVALPFLILLGLRSNRSLCLLLVLATAVDCCVGIDIVRDRRIGPPSLVPGAIRQAVAGKPCHRIGYLVQLVAKSRPQTVVIGDAWSWDYAYAVERGKIAIRSSAPNFAPEALVLDSDGTRLLLPRDYISDQPLLRRLRDRGFVLVMDRLLWRTIHARYELSSGNADLVSIEDVPVRLVDVGTSG